MGTQVAHSCIQSMNYGTSGTDGILQPPDEFRPGWRMVVDETALKVSFCPFCGERLPADTLASASRLRKGMGRVDSSSLAPISKGESYD